MRLGERRRLRRGAEGRHLAPLIVLSLYYGGSADDRELAPHPLPLRGFDSQYMQRSRVTLQRREVTLRIPQLGEMHAGVNSENAIDGGHGSSAPKAVTRSTLLRPDANAVVPVGREGDGANCVELIIALLLRQGKMRLLQL